jgi:hypothetical protein
MMKLTPIVGGILQLNELIIYIIIYMDLYKHDRSLASKSVISIDAYKSRQKHNSFTLACQMACFAIDGIFILHLLVLNAYGKNFSSKELSFSMRVPQFALQTMLQILTFTEIREKLKSHLIFI